MILRKQISRQFCDYRKQNNYIKPISSFREFISKKFLQFIESYERILEKRFPKTFKIYRVFKIGLYLMSI